MEIIISYSEALKQHPDIVKKWTDDAKSPKYLLDPEKLKWSYYFGVAVQGVDGIQFAHKIRTGELFEENKKIDEKTPEQIANETISNVVGLSFKVTGSGFKREKSIKEPTDVFIEKYKAIINEYENEKMKERQRIDNLTPEEREREEQELLNELFGMDGFFGIQLGQQSAQRMTPKPIQYDINDILDKISRVGVVGLTKGEQKFLDDQSKK
jgi:hypothetical protein